MFVKTVIILLLLIVVASLVTGSNLRGRTNRSSASARIRPLMINLSFVLVLIASTFALYHLLG